MTSYVAKASLGLASILRKMGTALDGVGKKLEVTKYTEKLVPSTRFVAVNGVAPTISEASFVAPSASIIGNVALGHGSSVWYGAVVRGDVNFVTIGDRTSIGDRAVVHVAKIQGDFPTEIGDGVTIGAGALVHAATLHDGCVVGESAQVLDGAVVEARAMVAPASIVTPGTTVAAGELWAGAPAKKVRILTEQELEAMKKRTLETVSLAAEHALENGKDYNQVLLEEEIADHETHPGDLAEPPPEPDREDVLGQGKPGLIFRSVLSHPEEVHKLKQK